MAVKCYRQAIATIKEANIPDSQKNAKVAELQVRKQDLKIKVTCDNDVASCIMNYMGNRAKDK